MNDTTELTTQLESLRNEHEAEQLRFAINQLRLATGTPLLEGWGDLVHKPRGFDDDASPFVPDSKIYDRTDGRFLPVYETEQDLANIRGSARNLVKLTGVRTGALDALANYVLGNGFTFKAASPDGTKTDESLLKTVQAFIDELLDYNSFTGDLDREIHQRSREDGEAAVILEQRESGRIKLRLIEPDQITQPHNARPIEDWLDVADRFPSCWKFGVHTPEGRTDEPLGFHVVYDGAGRDWDYIHAARMQFIKRNTTRNAKRGVSDFFEVVTDLTREAKLCRSMVTGAALQAAVAWVLKPPTGSTNAQVQALANTSANSLYDYQRRTAGGGSVTQYVKQYQDGTILHTAPGQEYADLPGHERNAGFEIVGQYALRRIGIRWCFPEYMISGDASNANYSSTMVAESPFVKAREADQAFYRRHFLELVWKAMRLAYDAGRFKSFGLEWHDLERSVDVTCEAPEVATRDTLKLTQTQETQIRMGILSVRTAASQSGLDYDREVQQGAKPQVAANPFGAMPGQPQQGSQPAMESFLENCGTGAGGFQAGNECAGGSGGSADSGKSAKPKKWSGKVSLRRGEKADISFEHVGGDRDSKRYRIAVTSTDGKKMGSAELYVFRDKRGNHFANLHPDVAPEFRRRGVATKMYLLGAQVAGKHGATLTASDASSMSDSAIKVWDKLEDKGKSAGWTIDRRRVMSVESIESAIMQSGLLLESWDTADGVEIGEQAADVQESLAEDCGTGAGGFQAGNDCAAGGGGGDSAKSGSAKTDTPEFKAWFGDSKVVDAAGKPLVVYHGTDADFKAFSGGATIKGIFHTDSPSDAGRFAGTGEGANVQASYVSIKNPKVYDETGKVFDFKRVNSFVVRARSAGHDGVIVRNVRNFPDAKPSTTYISFTSNQVKSATGNRGTFDPKSPKINESISENCGIGSDGFETGNECAAGGGGGESVAGPKAAYQMTAKEYAASRKGQRVQKSSYYKRSGTIQQEHYRRVADAIQSGRNVPRHVWKPYEGSLRSDGFGVFIDRENARESVNPTLRAAIEAQLESVQTPEEAKAIIRGVYP